MKTYIADYGMGNIGSIVNMVRKAGGSPQVSNDPVQLAQAERIILPGVGAFDQGMKALTNSGIKDAIMVAAANQCSILGICLGMQLMMDASEEGGSLGLGLVPGKVHRFPKNEALKVPHMGWNIANPVKDSLLFSMGANEVERFYFVHSYFAQCADKSDVAATSHYGFDFASAFSRNNIYGVQFHPEKSHRFGLELFKRFLV